MPGTRAGGLKAAKTIKAKNKNHYKVAGALGGAARGKKGMAIMMEKDPVKAKEIMSKGGKGNKKE
jgi:general stress protein YciG